MPSRIGRLSAGLVILALGARAEAQTVPPLGVLWKVEWIGIGGTYLWSDNISGWSIGGDIRLKF